MTDALTIEYTGPRGNRYRIRYRPSVAVDVDMLRIVDTWTGCSWHRIGEDPISEVDIDRGAEVIR